MTISQLIEQATTSNIFISSFDSHSLVTSESFQLLLNGFMDSAYGLLNILKRFEDSEKIKSKCTALYNVNEYKYKLLARTIDLSTLENYFANIQTNEHNSNTGSNSTTSSSSGDTTITLNKGEQINTDSSSATKGEETDTDTSSLTKGAQTNSDNSSLSKGEQINTVLGSNVKGAQTNEASGSLTNDEVIVTDTLGEVTKIYDKGTYTDTVGNGGSKTSIKSVQGTNISEFADSDKVVDTDTTTVTNTYGARQEVETDPETINTHKTSKHTDLSTNTSTEGTRTDSNESTTTEGARTDTSTGSHTEGARTDTSTGSKVFGSRTDTNSGTATEGARTDTTTNSSTGSSTSSGTFNEGGSKNIMGYTVPYHQLIEGARDTALFNLVSVVAGDIVKIICNRVFEEVDD